MSENINMELLTEGLKDHISIAREKAGIDEETVIELWYLGGDERVREGLREIFSDVTFNSESRVANIWDASEWNPPPNLGEGWNFPLGGNDITLWVTEYSPSQPS